MIMNKLPISLFDPNTITPHHNSMKPPALSPKITLAACLSLSVLLTGCFDTKEEFTLNPDGSGKVVHESTFQDFISADSDTNDQQESLRRTIKNVLTESEGVEAWRDVTYKRLDENRIFFRATAYFKDLSKLKIYNQTELFFLWRSSADGKLLLNLRAKEDHSNEKLTPLKEPALTETLSPEEQAKELKEVRAAYRKARFMMAEDLGPNTQETLFHLPGTLSQTSNFQTPTSGALKLEFDGVNFIHALDKLASNDAWMLKNASAFFQSSIDEDLSLNDDSLNEVLFGSNAPVQAVVTGPFAPLFDYAAEVAAAKKDFANTAEVLGIRPAFFAPPAQGEPLKNLTVAGVQFVNETERKHLRAFRSWHAGYTLAVAAEFSGSVLDHTVEGEVETAIAEDGSSLLPEKDSDRKIRSTELSNDRTAVMFEVPLKLPPKGVSGFKEISGQLQYKVADGVKEVDLGITELEKGAKGTMLGARIVSIGEASKNGGAQELGLELNVPDDQIKSVALVADGEKTELDQDASFSSPDSCTLNLTSEHAYPAKGLLFVEMYDNLRTYKAPFKLQNISLLGGSAAGK